MDDKRRSTSSKMMAGIDQVVSASQSRFIELLRTLVQTTPEGETAIQQLVRTQLQALGCEVGLLQHGPQRLAADVEFAAAGVDHTETRTSLVGHYRGTGGGRSLLMFAHPDCEPVQGLEHWRHDPFAGEIVGDRMVGWGVADDLQGVAAMIAGLAAAQEAGAAIAGDVILVSAPSKRDAMGIIAVLNELPDADGALYLHPAESGRGLADIKSATAGLLRFHITVAGAAPPTVEPTHTPFYHLAVDPMEKAWQIYGALRQLDEERGRQVRHQGMEAAVGRATNLQIAHVAYGRPDKLSRVATQAILAGSVTFPPGEPVAEVKAALLAAIGRVVAADEWLTAHPPLVEWLLGTTGVEVSQDHPLYQTVHQALWRVTGIEPRGHSLHSASDIRLPMLHRGVATVGFGSKAGDLTQAGGHDEWVDIPDYLRMIRAVALIIADWSGQPGGGGNAE